MVEEVSWLRRWVESQVFALCRHWSAKRKRGAVVAPFRLTAAQATGAADTAADTVAGGDVADAGVGVGTVTTGAGSVITDVGMRCTMGAVPADTGKPPLRRPPKHHRLRSCRRRHRPRAEVVGPPRCERAEAGSRGDGARWRYWNSDRIARIGIVASHQSLPQIGAAAGFLLNASPRRSAPRSRTTA
jgi:hypothetical protein